MAARALSRRTFLKHMGVVAAAGALGAPLGRATPVRAAAPGRLRFGIQARPEHTTYRAMLDVWQEAEALGFDSAFVFDHFMPIDDRPRGSCFEGWTLLSALAAGTRRVEVGVLVTGNTYRHPAVLAKMAATVDHVSNGRLILGMGAGWFEAEHTAYGIPFDTVGGRARRLVEAVTVVKSLFTQETSTFKGRYYELRDAPFVPKAVGRPHPPILIGGMGPKVIQPLAARHADIWHFSVKDGDPAQAKERGAFFDAICRRVGRDPGQIEKSISLRAGQLAGKPPKEIRSQVQALAEAGVRHFILSLPAPYDRRTLGIFAKEVMPALREA
jgi:F420-dependent oxidoreductase-like protein